MGTVGALLRDCSKPNDEIAARRAVAGVDEEIIAAGGSPEQADAFAIALRRYLLGDEDGAREVLAKVFKNGMVNRILVEFGKGAADAA